MRWDHTKTHGRQVCETCGHPRAEHTTQGCMAEMPYTEVAGVGRVDCPCGLYWTNDYSTPVKWPCGCGHGKHDGACRYPGCLCGHEPQNWQSDRDGWI